MSECPKLPAGHPSRTRKRSREDPTNDNNPNTTGEGVVPTATDGNATNQPFPNPNSTGEGVVPTATDGNTTNETDVAEPEFLVRTWRLE